MKDKPLPRRINLSFPWDKDHRAAFYQMADELKTKPAAELGRRILAEFMLCHFGLERSKTLGILSAIAVTLPPPLYLAYASRTYEEHINENPGNLQKSVDTVDDDDIKPPHAGGREVPSRSSSPRRRAVQ